MLLSGLLVSFAAVAQEPFENIWGSNAGAGAGDWSNPGNVVGPPDDNCANMGAVDKANTTYNFDFNIPLDATITGVVAHIKAGENGDQNIGVQLASDASGDPPTTIGNQRQLFVPGVGSGNCAATILANLGTTLADWGLVSLAPATVNAAAFGVVFTKLETSSIKVDAICLEILYETDTGPSVQQECFTETPPETNTITIVKSVVGAAPDSQWAFNGSGDIGGAFTLPAVGGFLATSNLDDDTYTITETTKPGYTVTSECFIADVSVATGDDEIQVAVAEGESATCTFTNTLNTANFTVTKDFSDDSDEEVSITLECTDGDVTTNPLTATEGSPAEFEVTGFEGEVTCTATEDTVPAGYTMDDSDCQDGDPLGQGCTITNTVNTGSFTVRKEYTAGGPDPVNVTATCTEPADVTNNPQPASPSGSAIFEVTHVVPGETTCTATEVVPEGYTADESDCQNGDPIDGSCVIVNSPISRATFRVTKDFTDDNPMGVEVRISCNTGLPLDQTKVISEGEFVEFVVVEYDPDEMDCDVDEVVPDGYSPTYSAGAEEDGVAGEVGDDENGCFYEDVLNGGFTCHIVNTPDPVDIVITKEWVFEGSSNDQGINTYYELTLYCDTEILWGSENCLSVNVTEAPVGSWGELWCKQFSGNGPDVFEAQAIPDYPTSECWVVENVFDDAVEVDNGCESLTISAGNGASCTIVNTVFFEGIPTLNQYGLAMLALLMLGIGFVGFRRFA